MLLGFLLIWCFLFVVLTYDLKQNNINSILRATCLTLITYIVLDINVKEYFNNNSIVTTTGSGGGTVDKDKRTAAQDVDKDKRTAAQDVDKDKRTATRAGEGAARKGEGAARKGLGVVTHVGRGLLRKGEDAVDKGAKAIRGGVRFGREESKKVEDTGVIDMPDTITIDGNPITKQAKTYKTNKNMCKYIKEQQRITVNSLYQNFKELQNVSSINDTQIEVLQNNFNDLITVNQYTDICDS